MKQPDLELIFRRLQQAPNIQLDIDPIAAYFLTALLQLSLRHPRLKVENTHSYENGVRIARLIQQRLGEIDPAIAQSIELGWDESLDMTANQYEQFSKTDDLPQRNYSQLRQDIQEEVIANSIAFAEAIEVLSLHLGGSKEQWVHQLAERANTAVSHFSQEEIRERIAQIDFMRDFGSYPPPA